VTPAFYLELSRKGQTTSSLRRHLRLVHQLKEFDESTIKSKQKDNLTTGLSIDAKRKLHALALNAIIQDGRSFNDLNKPGIIKLFNSLSDGKLQRIPALLVVSTFRISSTASKYYQEKS
jgi:hypothetical protein